MNATLRQATVADMTFLLTTIEAAESFGSNDQQTTYEHMFSLSRGEFEDMLRTILIKDTTGHQLALASFFLLADETGPIAGCAAWVEAADGTPSGFKVAALLSGFMGIKRWIAAKQQIRAMSRATPPRTPGALQLETFYVDPAYRGQGLTANLIGALRDRFAQNGVAVPIEEIAVLVENTSALKAYQRAGFDICRECLSSDPIFHGITASRGFVQVRAARAGI